MALNVTVSLAPGTTLSLQLFAQLHEGSLPQPPSHVFEAACALPLATASKATSRRQASPALPARSFTEVEALRLSGIISTLIFIWLDPSAIPSRPLSASSAGLPTPVRQSGGSGAQTSLPSQGAATRARLGIVRS